MTPSEPQTPTGRQLVEDEPRLVTGEHDMRTRVLAIEQEAQREAQGIPLIPDGCDQDRQQRDG